MIQLNEKYVELSEHINSQFGNSLKLLSEPAIELGYSVTADNLINCCELLRDSDVFGFDMLMDVSGVDYLSYGKNEWETLSATNTGFSRGVSRAIDPSENESLADTQYKPPGRFAVVYHLLSIANNLRLRLKVFCENDERPVLDSITGIWASADWYEREIFDLYGIVFRGHPDLRRILTDYGFIGHPFRKDFPLEGNVEMRYDSEKGRVVYQPVTIEPRTLVPKTIRDDNRYTSDLKNK